MADQIPKNKSLRNMKRGLILMMILSGIQAHAQFLEEMPKQVFLSSPVTIKELPGSTQVLDRVLAYIPEPALKPGNFSLLTYRESPVGYHYLYQFQLQGI